MSIVRLQGVSLTIGVTPILRDVDLDLAEGECLGIAGPNGVGKTTMLMVLATLQSPTGGTGSVMGAVLGTPEITTVRREIGLSGHAPALYDDLTLAENLLHVARLADVDSKEVSRTLAEVGLDAAARVIVDEVGRRVLARGGAFVTVSHDPAALGRQADRVVELAAGMVR